MCHLSGSAVSRLAVSFAACFPAGPLRYGIQEMTKLVYPQHEHNIEVSRQT